MDVLFKFNPYFISYCVFIVLAYWEYFQMGKILKLTPPRSLIGVYAIMFGYIVMAVIFAVLYEYGTPPEPSVRAYADVLLWSLIGFCFFSVSAYTIMAAIHNVRFLRQLRWHDEKRGRNLRRQYFGLR